VNPLRRTHGRIGAAVALLLPIAVCLSADLPQLQEGLWEIRTQTIANPGNKKDEGTVKICRDHAYDKEAMDLAKNLKGCTFTFESVGAGRYSSESHCTIDGTVISSKGTASYQSTSNRSETHTTYTPAFYGKTDETTIQDQKYLGSCPAGMKPGDQMNRDGTIESRGR
jgi:hypothetical protein